MSKANSAKLKQGIAVRFHGEEGMVSIMKYCVACKASFPEILVTIVALGQQV